MIKIKICYLIWALILSCSLIILDIVWFKYWLKKNKDAFIDKKHKIDFFLTAPLLRPFPELLFSNPKNTLSQFFRLPDKINWIKFRIIWGILGSLTYFAIFFLIVLCMVYLVTGGTVMIHVNKVDLNPFHMIQFK